MLENKAFKDTFCWNDKGTTFIVKDTNEFSRTILPKHFKHCNFASFVRQLNKYDFHKVRNGDDGQKVYGDQACFDRKESMGNTLSNSDSRPGNLCTQSS